MRVLNHFIMYTHVFAVYPEMLVVVIFGSIDKTLPFQKVDGLKFDNTRVFDAILNL